MSSTSLMAAADALQTMGRPHDAAELIRTALRTDPENVDLSLRLARLELALGRHDDSRRLVQWVITRRPDDGEALQLLAFCLTCDSKFREAVAASEQGLALDPDAPWRLVNHARINRLAAESSWGIRRHRALGEADRCAKRAVAIDPTSTSALCEAARIALLRRRPEEAADCAGRAVEIDPMLSDAHLLLGMALQRVGDDTRASDHLATAGQMSPHGNAAIDHLRTLTAPRLALAFMAGIVPFVAAANYATKRLIAGEDDQARVALWSIAAYVVLASLAVWVEVRLRRRRLTRPAQLAVSTHRQTTKRSRQLAFRRDVLPGLIAFPGYLAFVGVTHLVADSPEEQDRLESTGSAVVVIVVVAVLLARAWRRRRAARS